jgi:hypothetical protein
MDTIWAAKGKGWEWEQSFQSVQMCYGMMMVYNWDVLSTLCLGYVDNNDTHVLQYVIACEGVLTTLFHSLSFSQSCKVIANLISFCVTSLSPYFGGVIID